MMKWFLLIGIIGCFGNASGFVNKPDDDDDWDDEFDDYEEITHLKSVKSENNPEKYTIKERIYWAIGGLIMLIIFFSL